MVAVLSSVILMLPLLLFLAQIKDLGVKAGVVLNPGTSLTTIEEVGLGPCSTVPSN